MFSYNRVNLIGYQTQPVEVRTTPSGTNVTDLNLVVPYTFTAENGEKLEGRSFHTVTLWGGMAGVAGQFVRPGSQLFISGRLQTDTWEDDQSKEKRYKTKIVALDLTMLDPKDGQREAPQGAPLLTGCLNRADLVGNITRDPELRTTTGGQQVATVGIATNDRWKDKATGEDKERSEFHNVVLWGPLAEQASKTLKKGQRVFASGRVQTRSWDAPDGSKRYTTEIVAEQICALGIKNAKAMESLRTDGAPRKSLAPALAPSSSGAPSAEEAMVAAGAVPEVQYASEVKVEDLPF